MKSVPQIKRFLGKKIRIVITQLFPRKPDLGESPRNRTVNGVCFIYTNSGGEVFLMDACYNTDREIYEKVLSHEIGRIYRKKKALQTTWCCTVWSELVRQLSNR